MVDCCGPVTRLKMLSMKAGLLKNALWLVPILNVSKLWKRLLSLVTPPLTSAASFPKASVVWVTAEGGPLRVLSGTTST